MRSIRLVTVLCAVVFLGGCASMGMEKARFGGPTDPCTAAQCDVVITVTGCSSAQIIPEHEKYHVARGNRPVMMFKLAPRSIAMGWRFASPDTTGKEGIVFKTAAGQGALERLGNSPVNVKFQNKHPAEGVTEYEYGINIVQVGGSAGSVGQTCPQKDPWVVNL